MQFKSPLPGVPVNHIFVQICNEVNSIEYLYFESNMSCQFMPPFLGPICYFFLFIHKTYTAVCSDIQ